MFMPWPRDPQEREDGLTVELVWMFWRSDKSLSTAGI